MTTNQQYLAAHPAFHVNNPSAPSAPANNVSSNSNNNAQKNNQGAGSMVYAQSNFNGGTITPTTISNTPLPQSNNPSIDNNGYHNTLGANVGVGNQPVYVGYTKTEPINNQPVQPVSQPVTFFGLGGGRFGNEPSVHGTNDFQNKFVQEFTPIVQTIEKGVGNNNPFQTTNSLVPQISGASINTGILGVSYAAGEASNAFHSLSGYSSQYGDVTGSFIADIPAGALSTVNKRPVGSTVEASALFAGGEIIGSGTGFLTSIAELNNPATAKAGVLLGEAGLGALGVASITKKTDNGYSIKSGFEIGQTLYPSGLAALGFSQGFSGQVSPYLVPSANEALFSKIPIPSLESVNFIEQSSGSFGGSASTFVGGFRFGDKGFPLVSFDKDYGFSFGKNGVSNFFAERLLSAPEGSGFELGKSVGTSALEQAGIKVGNYLDSGALRLSESVPTVKTIYREGGKYRARISSPSSETAYLPKDNLASVYSTGVNEKDILFGSLGRTAYGVVKQNGDLPNDFDILSPGSKNLDNSATPYIVGLKDSGLNVFPGEIPGTINMNFIVEGLVKVGEVKGGVPADEFPEPSLFTAGHTKAFPVRTAGKSFPRITDLSQENRNLGSNVITLQRTSSGADYLPFTRREKDVSSFEATFSKLGESTNPKLAKATTRYRELYGEFLQPGQEAIDTVPEVPSNNNPSFISKISSLSPFTSSLSFGSKSSSSSSSSSQSNSKSPSISPSLSQSPSISPSLSQSISPSISNSKSPSISPSLSLSPRSVSGSPSISPSLSFIPKIIEEAGLPKPQIGGVAIPYSKKVNVPFKRKYSYLASESAAAFNIRASRAQKNTGYTGLEIRPIAGGLSKKKSERISKKPLFGNRAKQFSPKFKRLNVKNKSFFSGGRGKK